MPEDLRLLRRWAMGGLIGYGQDLCVDAVS